MMSYLYFLSFKYRLMLHCFDLIDTGSCSDKSSFLMERENIARIEFNSVGGMNSTFPHPAVQKIYIPGRLAFRVRIFHVFKGVCFLDGNLSKTSLSIVNSAI